MTSLPDRYRALVLGSSGALGAAFIAHLRADPRCAEAVGLTRHSDPGFSLEDEASLRACAQAMRPRAPFHLLIDATGALQIDGRGPEKRSEELDARALLRAFEVNAVGPAILLSQMIPLLATDQRVIVATLSARVGSISDNRKGGWYGYRASKAALNMLLRTLAIEASRRRPLAVFAALQPGTVRSPLSAPFSAGLELLEPEDATARLLRVLDGLPACREAVFADHQGMTVPW